MQRLIDQYPLQRGSHPSRDDGMCAMEMVSWLAGEAHSDEPDCACPVLSALVRACNDAMTEHLRNHYLRPMVPQLVHTRANATVERLRGLMAVDCLVRELLPKWLDRHCRSAEADLMRGIPPIRNLSHVRAATRVITTYADDHRAAQWVLDRALEGAAPARYVAGVVQLARALNDGDTWTTMVALIERMAAVRIVRENSLVMPQS
ncbi:MAG: hypothetical protein ACI89X_000956 [Planctomycetota bacterium]|jgi:hypothetical protein